LHLDIENWINLGYNLLDNNLKGIIKMLDFNFLLAANDGGLLTIGLVIGMFALLYFFMIRPQKKREKEEAAMRDAVQVGDEITTIGGIIGKVIAVKGDTFVLESTKDRTRLRFLKGAIRSVDVRAADIAAAILETKEVAPTETQDEPEETATETVEAPIAEEANLSKRAARKARRAAAAAEAASAMSKKMIEEANAIAAENERIEAEKTTPAEEAVTVEAPAAEAVAEEAAPETEKTEENA
jgi:preprotein translocase subunit YajC